ncbi:MAG TPA: molybdopterin-dependent oxidoreductase [Gemmatimonadaceae bacterium]|nr:molybdopterin-dependent oxidoreductase [Gemmatimonadaceae bacterium]
MIDRRKFIALGGSSLAAALAAACDSQGPRGAQRILRFAERRNEGLERWLTTHDTRDVASRGARDARAAFPEYFISRQMPVWDAAARGVWRLEVGGAVRRPASLTLDDLQRLPRVSQRVNHYCVEGWTAAATWHGVRVRDLARLVEPAPEVGYVDFESFDDGYHESWDLESATHPQTLVAYGMDGHLLSPGHGAPARLHSPVKLGYKNTKYLTRVMFLPKRTGGYWSDQGYEWYGGV